MKKHKKAEDEDFGYLNEEESAVSLPMIIGGAVLVVVIIVLCVLLWQLLHQEKPAGASTQNATMAADTLVNQAMAGNATREPSSAQRKEEAAGVSKPDDSEETVGFEAEDSNATSSEVTGDGEADKSSEAASDGATSSDVTGSSEGNASSEASEDQIPDQSQGITMTFRDVEETVTAKDVTNLRSEPSTTGESTVVAQLKNGETVKRTGINDTTGWSRLEYKGAIVYASGRLLTTDLTAKPAAFSQNAVDTNTVTTAAGRIITFTPCDDMVSPKMEVNLRLEPSTNQGDNTVHCRLLYGENVHRTGYDDASGWSRVEYDGKVLYVVTSYIFVVEEPSE